MQLSELKIELRVKPLKAALSVIWFGVLLLFAYFTWGFIAIDRAVKAYHIMLSLTVVWLLVGIATIAWSRMTRSSQT